jgi:hypothetical protein
VSAVSLLLARFNATQGEIDAPLAQPGMLLPVSLTVGWLPHTAQGAEEPGCQHQQLQGQKVQVLTAMVVVLRASVVPYGAA